MEWSETGIAGAHRFTQRLHRVAASIVDGPAASVRDAEAELTLLRLTHRTIVSVTAALEQFAFNVAVARLHELLSAIAELQRSQPGTDAAREALVIFCRLAAPMIPHLACEILATLSPDRAEDPDLTWPVADPELITVDHVTVAVQIMGKLRGTIRVPIGMEEAAVVEQAAAEEHVRPLLAGKQIVKRIYVPGRIVNFVIRDGA